MIAKIVDGKIAIPPRNDGNVYNADRDAGYLAAHGYREMTEAELSPYRVTAPAPAERYSQLAIIRALGDRWESVRAELSAAGLLDEFFAADCLASDDPAFAAFLAGLPDADKALLSTCRRED